MSFSGAFRSGFSHCSRSSFGSNVRISCSAAGARTSFSKPSASTFAFARNSSSKPAQFQASSGLSSFLNSPPSAFGSRSSFASASTTNSVPGATRSPSSPSTSTTSTSSVSTTSTTGTSSSSVSSAAAVLSDDSDANENDSESSRIFTLPFEVWPYPTTAVHPRLEEYYRQYVLKDLL
ncbi:hypothetical protein HK096_007865, partial [Nowakowskiella sp. JEL0078]